MIYLRNAYLQADGSYLVNEEGAWRRVLPDSPEGQWIAASQAECAYQDKLRNLERLVSELGAKHAALCMKKQRVEAKLRQAEQALEEHRRRCP